MNLWLQRYVCGSLASISPPTLAVNTKCNLHHFSCQCLYDEKLQVLLVTSEGVSSQLILTILLVDGGHLKCHGVISGGVTNAKVTESLGMKNQQILSCPVCHIAKTIASILLCVMLTRETSLVATMVNICPLHVTLPRQQHLVYTHSLVHIQGHTQHRGRGEGSCPPRGPD